MSRRTSLFGPFRNPLSTLRILSSGKSLKEEDERPVPSVEQGVCSVCGENYITRLAEGITTFSPCCSEQHSQLLASGTASSAGGLTDHEPTNPRQRRNSFKSVSLRLTGRPLAKLLAAITKRSSPRAIESHTSNAVVNPTNEHDKNDADPTSYESSIIFRTIDTLYLGANSTRSPPPPTFSASGSRAAAAVSSSLAKPNLSVHTSATTYETCLSSPNSYEVPSPTNHCQGVDLSGQVRQIGRYPFETGGAADVFQGEMITDGSKVAIKIFRRLHTDGKTFEEIIQRLYEDAKLWQTLQQENILPFLGICRDIGPSIALISPFCSKGPIMKYLHQNPKTRKETLDIAIGIANGLSYLHGQGIVHGNLSTSKILIDDNETPVICSYGRPQIPGQLGPVAPPVRFTAPECFGEDQVSQRNTPAADVYSFSMVILEILSGQFPYHEIPADHSVLFYIVRGGRPRRDNLDPSLFTDNIWGLLIQLWNQLPNFRPTMGAILSRLIALQSGQVDGSLMRPNNSDSPPIPSVEIPIVRVEDTDNQLDSQFIPNGSSGEESSYGELYHINSQDLKGRVVQTDQYPFAHGGNSNLYRGQLTTADGREILIAIKMIRISEDGLGQADEIARKLKREAAIWSQFNHKNLLPFIGICDDISPWPVLVAPFYKNGHIQKYLKLHPDANRSEMVFGVASGLEHLHSHNVVHGDLKAQNVLIDKNGNPCICDFGISKVTGTQGFTTLSIGTVPYMAPELFLVLDGLGQDGKLPTTTKSSDVYSFGLLALEILTSTPPKRRPVQAFITAKVHSELRPEYTDYQSPRLSGEVWDVLDKCWTFEPGDRPTMENLLVQLFDCLPEHIGDSADNADRENCETVMSELD